MAKLVVGPVDKGLRTDRTAFVIDNDSFPTLINAYQWRGRVKRKRGTSLLTRLQRFFNSTSISYNPGSTSITLGNDGSGNGTGNLLTGFTTLQPNASLVLGSINITDTTSGQTYTDSNGVLTGSGGGSGTVNYSTGAIVINMAAGDIITATFLYYPTLPVMGLEDLILLPTEFPGTLAFDTTYSYNILTTFPYASYDVSFYKNPATGTYPGYVQKTNTTPVIWNGNDYQQFWTTNYQGALWATNGIDLPFTGAKIGMQFKSLTNISFIVPGPPATCLITVANHALVTGDFVFINEVPNSAVTGINFQTGYVVNVLSVNTFTVEFPNTTLGGAGGNTTGIVQYLTNTAVPGKDCIRWYDGDPTNGNATAPTLVAGKGWVNFSPPLSQAIFSIADLPQAQYYLVGARIIIPFKDRLLFFGPVIQSSTGSPMYLQDTVIYSQNGTPYYTCSYTNTPNASKDTPVSASNVFNPILVPVNQTATSPAYFEDQTGFGGFITAGIAQPITGVGSNEDALIVEFNVTQTRLIYTGDDLIPFNFFIINSEFGCSSVFSVITMDQGIIARGNRGIVITGQTSSQRIDLEIPDQVFEMQLTNNGAERITAQRDFINEWIYLTYVSNENGYVYPTQTLQYNYRDNSWSIFNEMYTTYGQFKKASGYTWLTVPWTWESWDTPWIAGASTVFQPDVIGGNTQGFVMVRETSSTDEGTSLAIQNISGSVVTSPNHCLNNGDYIVITGALGTIGSLVNGKIFSVSNPSTNSFSLNPSIGSGTYLGGGLIQRMYIPFIMTKQFPTAWSMARKTRIGPQQYLFTTNTSTTSQIQLLIFLSQNSDFAYNDPLAVNNGSLIYSTVLYTCPESTNLGLTPANINLQIPTAFNQNQTWHRMNTSLIGDTVQIGFTMSDAQMRDPNFNNQFVEIELHGFILDVAPSQVLV